MGTNKLQSNERAEIFSTKALMASLAGVFLMGAYLSSSEAKSPPPPPPSKVWVSDLRGVTLKTGTFILQWNPATIPSTQTPYQRYQLPGAGSCKFTPFPGDSIVPAASGTVILTTSVNRVTAVCAAGYLVSGVRTAPPDGYTPGSSWAYTEKFLVPSTK